MTRLDGADLSHYNTITDWSALRAATWWCATKATQGIAATDPTFVDHWGQMRRQVFRHRLAYHWLDPVADPVVQAQHFLKVAGPFGVGEGAMLDAEQGGITVAGCLKFCEAVEAVTHRPVAVYTGAYVAGGTIWQNTGLRKSKYGARPFHLAAYTTEAKALALTGVKAYPWDAWQFSSNGPVPGVAGRCDMNRIDNVAVFDVACGITSTGSTPPLTIGDDMPAFMSNKQPGKYGAPSPQGGCSIWELVHNTKSALSLEAWIAYGQPYGVPVDDSVIDAIPDFVANPADVDEVALANALAPLIPSKFHGNIEITAAST